MKRILLAALSLLLSLLVVAAVVLGWLLFTTGGARWISGWLLEHESRLTLTIVDGALASGLQLEQLAWRDEGITFTAAAAEFAWTPDCLMSRRVCIDALRLQSPRLIVEPTDSPAEESTPLQRIELPIAIRLDLLQLADAEFELPSVRGQARLLQTSGSFEAGSLTLNWARLQGLRVVVPQQEPTALAAVAAAEPAPIRLPTVALPLDLAIDGFLLEDAELVVANRHWPVESLALNLGWRGTELDLRGLQLGLPQVKAELRGSIRLEGGYPLELAVQARVDAPELPQPLNVSGKLSDSLAGLSFAVSSDGAVSATVAGTLRPLESRLPFSLEAHWQSLGWPLAGEQQLVSPEGRLTAQGNLDGYSLKLDSGVAGTHVPEGRWQLEAAGDFESLRIQRLSAQTLGGRLTGGGVLAWREGFSWEARLEAENIEPGRFWPQYPGRLSGAVSSEGAVLEEGWRMRAQTTGIAGTLRDYPLALQGSVRRGVNGQWQFQQLRLASGDNRIEMDGRLQEQWDLKGRFELPTLSALLPELKGAASGRFSLGGPLRTPDLQLSLTAERLGYQSYALRRLELSAEVARLGYAPGTLRWQATGVTLSEQVFKQLSGQLTGSRDAHRLAVQVEDADLGGSLLLTGRLADNLDWSGSLLEADVLVPPTLHWRLAEPVALRWRQAAGRLSLAAHCWRQQQSSLCLTEPATIGSDGALALALADFQLYWLAAWLPEEVRWSGPLGADARIRWQPDSPLTLSVQAHSEGGQFQLLQDQADALALGYQRLAASVELASGGLDARLSLQSDELGSGDVVVRTSLDTQPRPLAGQVNLEGLRLDVIKPFLPQIQTLAGTLSAQGRLDGNLRQPQFFGRLQLADGRVASPALPLELQDVQLTAQVRGNEADLSGRFQSGGEGTGSLDGTVVWGEQDWQLALNIRGDELLVTYAPLASVRVDPDLAIRVRPKQVAVDGRIVIPRGQITLEELPEGAVEISEDVVVVRRPGDSVSAAEAAEPMPGWSVSMNIELVLGDAVEISGQGLSGRLTGSLNLRQRAGGIAEALGELRVEDGKYEAYGQELEIRQGQLLFSGSLTEPNLNIEAVREVEDVVAGIRVDGRPDEPRATLFSEPGMPQADILSYIIRGRPLNDDGGTGSGQLLAQAALSLGIFGGKGIATSLAEELGVKDFEVGSSGEGEGTQFELSGYLNPDLFVRYGVGVFAPVNTLTLRYRLDDHFFIEAISSLENAIDVLYEFRF